VAIADSAKDNNGVQVFAPDRTPNDIPASATTTAPVGRDGAEGTEIGDKVIASTSSSTAADISAPERTESGKDTNEILDQAQKLFDQKEYDQALNKLKEADELIK
jgi:hypothetical protein